MSEIEQAFAALPARDKMKFLRWAAESVGAKLDTVFGPADEASEPDQGSMYELVRELGEMDIPESLRR